MNAKDEFEKYIWQITNKDINVFDLYISVIIYMQEATFQYLLK